MKCLHPPSSNRAASTSLFPFPVLAAVSQLSGHETSRLFVSTFITILRTGATAIRRCRPPEQARWRVGVCCPLGSRSYPPTLDSTANSRWIVQSAGPIVRVCRLRAGGIAV